jgi:hypothetical protein
MENHFLEYLIPKLYERNPVKYFHFFEDRLERICHEEGFVCFLQAIHWMAPAIRLEAESSTATKTFGVRYEVGYSVIAGKPQILKKEYLVNGKPAEKAPGRFKERLDILDARVRRLFPDEPILLTVPA